MRKKVAFLVKKSGQNIWIVLSKSIPLHSLFDQEWSTQQKLRRAERLKV
jgi:hypothetical protein